MAIKNGSVIGIDFGTTNTSIISLMKDDLGEKCVVLGEDGEFPFASLLAISKDNRVFFGNKVRKNHDSFSESYRLVSSFKSLLGTGESIEINGKPCPPKQIAAEYFKCLKRVIAKKYNIDITEAAFSFRASTPRPYRGGNPRGYSRYGICFGIHGGVSCGKRADKRKRARYGRRLGRRYA